MKLLEAAANFRHFAGSNLGRIGLNTNRDAGDRFKLLDNLLHRPCTAAADVVDLVRATFFEQRRICANDIAHISEITFHLRVAEREPGLAEAEFYFHKLPGDGRQNEGGRLPGAAVIKGAGDQYSIFVMHTQELSH